MMHGTYVRGWKFGWQEGREDFEKYMGMGLEFKAASCADPGCCSCPECGEMHWREFEVFLCSRCGAELTMPKNSTGRWDPEVTEPPTRPEMRRKKLHDGMRVRYRGRSGTDVDGNPKLFPGRWPAGTIQPGERGTIRKEDDNRWRVDFDGRTPRYECVWGVFGPFLDDDFEEVA